MGRESGPGPSNSGIGIKTVSGNLVDNTDSKNPIINGVSSVSGLYVDNFGASTPVINGIYTLPIAASIFNPADLATYWIGSNPKAPTTGHTVAIRVPINSKILFASIWWDAGGIVGSGESISIYITAGITDTLINTISSVSAIKNFENNVSISVGQGDSVEIKLVCPTFATNPTNVSIGGYLFLKY